VRDEALQRVWRADTSKAVSAEDVARIRRYRACSYWCATRRGAMRRRYVPPATRCWAILPVSIVDYIADAVDDELLILHIDERANKCAATQMVSPAPV
jgi:hypothetical protein